MPAIPTSGTDPVILALKSLSPEALSRCIVGFVCPLLAVARHERVDDVVRETMKKRYPEGGLFAIFDALRAGLPVENAAATIKSCEALERSAGKHRVAVRAARLYETAAYLTAHSVGVTQHRKTQHVANAARQESLAAIAFYVIDCLHGTIPDGQVRSLEGSEIHAAYRHRWCDSESDRQALLVQRAETSSADDLCRIPSLLASEVIGGILP